MIRRRHDQAAEPTHLCSHFPKLDTTGERQSEVSTAPTHLCTLLGPMALREARLVEVAQRDPSSPCRNCDSHGSISHREECATYRLLAIDEVVADRGRYQPLGAAAG